MHNQKKEEERKESVSWRIKMNRDFDDIELSGVDIERLGFLLSEATEILRKWNNCIAR